LRAEKIMQERLFRHPKISVIWNHGVDEILSEGETPGVTGVRLRDVNTGAVQIVPTDGVFIAIGHAPASSLVKGQVEMHHGDYVRTEGFSTQTSVPGLFAAGDVTDHVYRQAVTSAGMGCMAALEAERFLSAQDSGAAQAAE
jgi:thioredoxin reductase (NADPH)